MCDGRVWQDGEWHVLLSESKDGLFKGRTLDDGLAEPQISLRALPEIEEVASQVVSL